MINLFTQDGILRLILSIPGLLLAITFHEAAHGYAAYYMGDTTAKYQGRLTLNPLKHLDPMGAICMLLFRFGWAKPVPINPRYFKKQGKGIILVSLAGPMANFTLGFFSYLLFGILLNSIVSYNQFIDFVLNVLYNSIGMNVGLMIFNLIPIPPLDGSKIAMEFLPYRLKYQIYRYEAYFSIILLIFVYLGTASPILSTIGGWVINLYDIIAGPIISLFG